MGADGPIEAAQIVRALLQTQGIVVDDEEFERFVRMYPALRTGCDSLYIDETRYEEPALTFSPIWESS